MYENIKIFSAGNDDNPFGIRFVGETLCDDKFVIERKYSNMTSFEYIVDGYGTLEINGQILHPQKGDMFLITEGSCHKYYSQKENAWHKYFVSFYGDMITPLLNAYLPEDTYVFRNSELQKSFEKIFDIAFNNNTEDSKITQMKIATEIFKICNFLRYNQISENEDFADKIKHYIDMNIDKSFSLDELCKIMNYSKNHIINIFFEKFGITPYRYYTESKISIAKDYLTNTNMTISEIANKLSFSDQQYFSYFFKKSTGCSPKCFRHNTRV